MKLQDTIVASATGNIVSALGIIRMSGREALNIISKVFVPISNKNFLDIARAGRLYYGKLMNNDNILDECVVSLFKSPHSFTGEDIVEISHHGSTYIQQEILQILINNGARLADKGEFSLRAFLNGKMNLSQTEAIADLIASNSSTSHDLAIKQLRGEYNQELKNLRHRFIKIASLLELEIDFSAEQEVFVDKKELQDELNEAIQEISQLVNSFKQGNALKKGIPVAIVGKPNSGKSTLMNALLKDDRSIVSSIEGTTRDTIEESISIDGLSIRFIDTAGIRESDNEIEKEGIKRSFEAIKKAQVVLYMIDASLEDMESINYQLAFLKQEVDLSDKYQILIVNKEDISTLKAKDKKKLVDMGAMFISAKGQKGIDKVLKAITENFDNKDIAQRIFVTNIRHYEALSNALVCVEDAQQNLINGQSADIISYDIRQATEYIGNITGEITSEDILTGIFSSFCIGK